MKLREGNVLVVFVCHSVCSQGRSDVTAADLFKLILFGKIAFDLRQNGHFVLIFVLISILNFTFFLNSVFFR